METRHVGVNGLVFVVGSALMGHVIVLETQELGHGQCPLARAVCALERTLPLHAPERHPAPEPTQAYRAEMTVSATTSVVPTLRILPAPPANP